MKLQKSIFVLFKKYVFYTLAFTLLLSPFAYVASVYATSIYGTYPANNIGFYKMSQSKFGSRGQIGVSSARAYDVDIINAFDKVRASTKGTIEMPTSVWPNGYDMVMNNWTGTWNNYTDIMFTWAVRTDNQTYPYTQSANFCTFWGQPSTKCGWYIKIQYSSNKWDSYGPGLQKQRIVMHETGHGVGMKDYCTADSIMNNGGNDPNTGLICNPVWNGTKYVPKWTAIMSYQPTDRTAVKAIYP